MAAHRGSPPCPRATTNGQRRHDATSCLLSAHSLLHTPQAELGTPSIMVPKGEKEGEPVVPIAFDKRLCWPSFAAGHLAPGAPGARSAGPTKCTFLTRR